MQPTPTTQGGYSGAANFQACVEPFFSQLRGHLLAWLNEFALNDPSEAALLHKPDEFISICSSHNMVISLPTFSFYATEIDWCGRLIDAYGVRMDPSIYNGIFNTSES